MSAPATSPAVRDALAGAGLDERLTARLRFVIEADRVKQVVRRNLVTDASRAENDAEHQWHLALMAVVLAEHAPAGVDVLRVVTMLLIHDLVEIDAGDAYFYDDAARAAAAKAEAEAADRIFGLLPAGEGLALRELWEEFEEGATPDARFARSLDRLHPVLMNAASGGGAWQANGITAGRVAGAVLGPIDAGSPALGAATRAVLERAVADGALPA